MKWLERSALEGGVGADRLIGAEELWEFMSEAGWGRSGCRRWGKNYRQLLELSFGLQVPQSVGAPGRGSEKAQGGARSPTVPRRGEPHLWY